MYVCKALDPPSYHFFYLGLSPFPSSLTRYRLTNACRTLYDRSDLVRASVPLHKELETRASQQHGHCGGKRGRSGYLPRGRRTLPPGPTRPRVLDQVRIVALSPIRCTSGLEWIHSSRTRARAAVLTAAATERTVRRPWDPCKTWH